MMKLNVEPILIAGPCAAENREQVLMTADALSQQLKANGISLTYFRTGVWKWRSTPNTFCGAGEPALEWLKEVKQKYGFDVCVEVASPEQVDLCEKAGITALWIGSRTAVNPYQVQEIAEACKNRPLTVMVKNPLVPDLKLWIGDIERFMKADVEQVWAIHRGVADRAESVYRNAPCWEMPIDLRVRYPELPILCDPSHIAGDTRYIAQIAQLAIDFGCSGLMLESHCNPAEALSDAKQQLKPDELVALIKSLVFKSELSSPIEDDLRKQRNLIENIDVQMANLLAKRMQVVDEIANIKKQNNLPIVQPKQWNKVEGIYRNAALQDSDYEEFLTKYLELLHNASINRQK